MLLALILVAAVIILFCWLLFRLASLALPLFVAFIAARAMWHGGAGTFGAILVGLLAGGITLFAGQFLLATSRGVGARLAVILLFAAPAALAGFSASRGIAGIGGASMLWQVLLGLIGAACVTLAAIARLREGQPITASPFGTEEGVEA